MTENGSRIVDARNGDYFLLPRFVMRSSGYSTKRTQETTTSAHARTGEKRWDTMNTSRRKEHLKLANAIHKNVGIGILRSRDILSQNSHSLFKQEELDQEVLTRFDALLALQLGIARIHDIQDGKEKQKPRKACRS